jgi:hypothetical protein
MAIMERMRDWLTKYQRLTVVWWRPWLKRQLKARGYFPDPFGDQFVREWTELLLKDAHRHGPNDWTNFWEEMKSSPQMIESVIRDQVSIANQDAFTRRHFLVMKHLGYFEGFTLQS